MAGPEVKITPEGDWEEAARILGHSALAIRVAMDRAMFQEAHFFRRKVIEGFRDQAPGDQKFKELSETTLAIRRFQGFTGTKALIRRGDLRNAISVIKLPGGGYSVGVNKNARGRNGESLENIAEIHEFGAGPIIIPVTDAMRKFLMAAFRQELPGFGSGGGSGGLARGIIIVRIPARPFIRPVRDKYFSGPEAAARFQGRVAALLGGTLGTFTAAFRD